MSYPYGYSINEFGRFDVGGYGAVPDGPRRVRSLDQAKMVAARAWIMDGNISAESPKDLRKIAKMPSMPWAKGKTIGGVLGMVKTALSTANAKNYVTKMAKEYWDHTHPKQVAERKAVEAEAATEEPTAVVKYAPAPLPPAAPMPIAAAGTGMPGWVLPVGLGVGVLALLLLVTRPRSPRRSRAPAYARGY
jgi:hypothetical protein